MIKIFLSYAREDIKHVEDMYSWLDKNGFTPWMDTQDLIPGQEWRQQLEDNIRDSDLVLFFNSQNSVNKRGVFQREIGIALDIAEENLETDVFIVPVKLDDACLSNRLSCYQWLDINTDNWQIKLFETIKSKAKENKIGAFDYRCIGNFVMTLFAQEETNNEKRYDLDFDVPNFFIPDEGHRTKEINELVRGRIYNEVYSFRGSCAADISDENPYHLPNNQLSLRVHPYLVNSHFVSMEFATRTYFMGAAHGNDFYDSFNIHIDSNSVIGLENIFISDQFDFLTDCCAGHLALGSRIDDIKDQSARLALNGKGLFDNFVITKTGIGFSFTGYETSCYADGPRFINIHNSCIAPILKQNEVTDQLLLSWEQNEEVAGVVSYM